MVGRWGRIEKIGGSRLEFGWPANMNGLPERVQAVLTQIEAWLPQQGIADNRMHAIRANQ